MLKSPGCTVTTLTLNLASSNLRTSLKPVIACLVAVYTLRPGYGWLVATLVTLISLPRDCLRRGRQCLVTLRHPTRLVLTWSCTWSRVCQSNSPQTQRPGHGKWLASGHQHLSAGDLPALLTTAQSPSQLGGRFSSM